MNELTTTTTTTGLKQYSCKHSKRCFSEFSRCKRQELRTRDREFVKTEAAWSLLWSEKKTFRSQQQLTEAKSLLCHQFLWVKITWAKLKASPVGIVRKNLLTRHVSINITMIICLWDNRKRRVCRPYSLLCYCVPPQRKHLSYNQQKKTTGTVIWKDTTVMWREETCRDSCKFQT